MFLAVVESSPSLTSACRMACVIFKSDELFDWSPDVWVSPERSRSFVAVLSGFVLSSALKAATLSALRQAKTSKVRFIGSFTFIGYYFEGVPCRGLIATDTANGSIYFSVTLITDLAKLVTFCYACFFDQALDYNYRPS